MLKYLKNDLYPSVFTFSIETTKQQALKIMRTSTIIDHKTSFGCAMSRTDPWPIINGALIKCRVAIGYGDTFERIILGLIDIIDNI